MELVSKQPESSEGSVSVSSLRHRLEVLTARQQEAYNAFQQYSGAVEILQTLITESEEKTEETKGEPKEVTDGK